MKRPTFVSLAVSAFVATVAIKAAAQAQPVPRGTAVVVDPEAADLRFCPQLARQADGSVAVAWSRQDRLARERVLVRIADREGKLGPATSIEKDAEAILDVLDFKAVPGGLHLWWNHLNYGKESWRDVELDTQAQLRGATRIIRPVGNNTEVVRSLRPVGGFVDIWFSDQALFVRLLDDDFRAAGEIQRVSIPHVVGTAILHETSGAFVALIEQEFREERIETGLRAQRFDAEGRPVGPHQRLLHRHSGLLGIAATAGENGTLAVSAGYGFLFGAKVLTLSTFGADGALLGFRYKDDPAWRLRTETVAVDPEGRVLWVWYSINRGQYEAQTSSLGGHALSPVFPISTRSTPGSRISCANAVWAGSDWVVTWTMANTAYIRRFAR